MSLDRDIALLGSVKLLADLNADQLRLLAFGAEELNFQAGRALYREGQNADCGFVIIDGSVELVRHLRGQDHVLRTIGPKHLLGEMALITQTQRLTTAIAVEPTQVLRINRPLFRRMLEEYPEVAAKMHAELTARLTKFLDDIGRMEGRFSRPLKL